MQEDLAVFLHRYTVVSIEGRQSLKTSEQIQPDVNTAQTLKTRRRFPSLVVTLFLFELCYLLIVALSPLPELRLIGSPLALAWTWTLLPSRLLLALYPSSGARVWLSPALLGLALSGLLAAYAYSIRSVSRLSEAKRIQHRWLTILLGGAFLFSLTLLFQPTLFSDDVFTYIFSGRIFALYHADPFNTAPVQFTPDPYLRWVIAGRNAPNLYGPLWYYISSLLVSVGGNNQVLTLLLFKCLAVLSHLLNIALVWSILTRIAPQRRIIGTLLYAWNPLILIELASSGHSEGVLLLLLFLATRLYVARESFWLRIGAFMLFGLALSMNLIVALFAPLLLWFDVRSERAIPRAIAGFCWRAAIVLLPAISIWLPFWRGGSTFFALTSAIDMDHFVHSPLGTLVGPTHAFFRLIAYVLRFPSYWNPISSADVALRGSTTFIFVLIYGNVFGQVRHAPTLVSGRHTVALTNQDSTLPGFNVLLKAWSIAVFAYLMLVAGWFWPWYLLWLLWVVVLRGIDAFASAMLVLSGTVLFFYLSMGFISRPIALYQSTFIFGLPLVYLVGVKWRQLQSERTAILHDGRSETA